MKSNKLEAYIMERYSIPWHLKQLIQKVGEVSENGTKKCIFAHVVRTGVTFTRDYKKVSKKDT